MRTIRLPKSVDLRRDVEIVIICSRDALTRDPAATTIQEIVVRLVGDLAGAAVDRGARRGRTSGAAPSLLNIAMQPIRHDGELSQAERLPADLPEDTPHKVFVRLAKLRWRVESDCQELKEEIGLGQFEGRSWRGSHHRVRLCAAAQAFLWLNRAPPTGAPSAGCCRWCGATSSSFCSGASASVSSAGKPSTSPSDRAGRSSGTSVLTH